MNGTAIFAGNSSCSSFELSNAVFEENACSGICLAHLASSNDLQNVTVVRNKLAEGKSQNPSHSLFFMPPGSTTFATRLRALQNDMTVVELKEGNLNLSDSVFVENSAGSAIRVIQSDASFFRLNCSFNVVNGNGACLYLNEGNASIHLSTIHNNSANNGGAMFSVRSNLAIVDSEFLFNIAKHDAGVLYAERGRAFITNSTFSENRSKLGGGILCDGALSLNITNATFIGNHASKDGGTFKAINSCKSDFFDVLCSRNSAEEYGGAVSLENAETKFQNVTFAQNKGKNGGAVDVFQGKVAFTEMKFEGNKASSFGGAVNLQKTKKVMFSECFMKGNNATEYGGAVVFTEVDAFEMNATQVISCLSEDAAGGIYILQSTGTLQECSLTENKADTGAGLAIYDGAIVSLINLKLERNEAKGDGGGIYSQFSTLDLTQVRFKENNASSGGGIHGLKSNMTIADAKFTSCNASGASGGAISLKESQNVNIQRTVFIGNTAVNKGGALRSIKSSLKLERVFVSKSIADFGGIAADTESNISFVDTIVDGNIARQNGGGFVAENSTVTMLNSTFKGNEAVSRGGAIVVTGSSIKMDRSTFIDNEAEEGGSFHGSQSIAEIRSTNFLREVAKERGGAILLLDNCTLKLEASTFDGARARFGAAISIDHSLFADEQVTFLRCQASDQGGGVHATNMSTLFLSSSTFEENSAHSGGAVFVDSASSRNHAFQFHSCDFVKNSAAFGGCVVLFSNLLNAALQVRFIS